MPLPTVSVPREDKGGVRATIWSWPGEKWLAEKGGDSGSVVLKIYSDRDRWRCMSLIGAHIGVSTDHESSVSGLQYGPG